MTRPVVVDAAPLALVLTWLDPSYNTNAVVARLRAALDADPKALRMRTVKVLRDWFYEDTTEEGFDFDALALVDAVMAVLSEEANP